jgi:hypothetical protein
VRELECIYQGMKRKKRKFRRKVKGAHLYSLHHRMCWYGILIGVGTLKHQGQDHEIQRAHPQSCLTHNDLRSAANYTNCRLSKRMLTMHQQ